jgi:uroporphyrinogen-III synthase
MTARGIILTRPMGYNREFMQRITEAGYHGVERPLLTIEEVVPDRVSKARVVNLDHYDVVVFVSRNAVRYGMPHLAGHWPQWPERLKWCAVGEQTADELHHYDLNAIYPVNEGAQGLLSTMDWEDVEKVFIVRGKGGLAALQDGLEALAITVDYLEVYERLGNPHVALHQEVIDLQLDVVVLTSGEGIDPLCASIAADVLSEMTIVVPSERIKEMLVAKGLRNILVSGSTSDEAMLTTLASI